MSQPVNGTTPVVPVPPTAPLIDWTDPASIAMYLAALLAVAGFVFHKDLSGLAGPAATLAVAVIAAVKSIEQAIKQKAYQTALQQYNSLRMEHYINIVQPPALEAATQKAFDAVADHMAELEGKIAALQPQKPVQKATTARKTASRSPRTRRAATAR